MVITAETHHQRAVLGVVVEQQAKRGRLAIHLAQVQAKEILAARLVLLLLWVAVAAQVLWVLLERQELAAMEVMALRQA